DFGGYANPLALAKIWTGRRLLAVGRAETAEAGTAAPGTLLAVDREGLVLRTADGALRLSGLTDMAGEPADPAALGRAAGQVLPALLFPAAPAPEAVGRDEPFWEAALTAAEAAALPPYPMAHATAAPGAPPETAALDTGGAPAATVAAAWM